MPTYAYECQDCRNGFEVFQRMTEDPLTTCDSCGGSLKKKMFPAGIVFKGSGFYVNDYAAKKPAADGDSGSKSTSAESKTAADTSAKSDAPAAAAAKTDSTTTTTK